jgi:predicted lipid-binding transport protein (Tim44 family)
MPLPSLVRAALGSRVIVAPYDRAADAADACGQILQPKERLMKSLILALSFAVLCAGLAPFDAEARRLGGGSSAGMQRSLPARTPPAAAPAQPAQAAPTVPATAGAAPAAAPKRSWLGPIAGLAAGLGLAALMSHLGLGAEFGNIVMLALLGFVAFVAIRMLMSRFGRNAATGAMAAPNGLRFAGATPEAPGAPAWNLATPAAALALAPAAASSAALPAGFDAAAFERIAKMIFIRMQTANDGADLDDLRAFTTPEMFAAAKLDLQDRGAATQTTDVVRIDAEVLDVAIESQRQVVSVRFHGLIREQKDGVAEPFDEVWHLVKPADGSREWAIAGIQQTQAA